MAARVRLSDEPRIVNRGAIVVRRRQRILDWPHEVDSDAAHPTLEALRIEPTIYLLPELGSEGDVERVLRRCFDDVLTDHLDGWCRDEGIWPSLRSHAMCQAWFEWSCHSMVIDLDADHLAHDVD